MAFQQLHDGWQQAWAVITGRHQRDERVERDFGPHLGGGLLLFLLLQPRLLLQLRRLRQLRLQAATQPRPHPQPHATHTAKA